MLAAEEHAVVFLPIDELDGVGYCLCLRVRRWLEATSATKRATFADLAKRRAQKLDASVNLGCFCLRPKDFELSPLVLAWVRAEIDSSSRLPVAQLKPSAAQIDYLVRGQMTLL